MQIFSRGKFCITNIAAAAICAMVPVALKWIIPFPRICAHLGWKKLIAKVQSCSLAPFCKRVTKMGSGWISLCRLGKAGCLNNRC